MEIYAEIDDSYVWESVEEECKRCIELEIDAKITEQMESVAGELGYQLQQKIQGMVNGSIEKAFKRMASHMSLESGEGREGKEKIMNDMYSGKDGGNLC
jgi:hypothetical protein